MDTLEDFQNLKTQLQELFSVSSSVSTALTSVTPTTDVTSAEQSLTNVISVLQSFVTINLNALEGQEVINNFLGELKTLFDKYSASVSVTDSAGGYGQDYGQGGAASITFTATTDGVTGSKTFNKTTVASGDLV